MDFSTFSMGQQFAYPPQLVEGNGEFIRCPPQLGIPPMVGGGGGPQLFNFLPCGSTIASTNTHPCNITRFDPHLSTYQEQPSQQIFTADNRLFIEHTPNHSILFIPNDHSLDKVLQGLLAQAKASAATVTTTTKKHVAKASTTKTPREKSNKPINAFIKYRSYKIAELKKQYPDVSQTEISRLAGECWKTESEEIKNQFRVRYKEEKRQYDLNKASNKRTRESPPSEDLPKDFDPQQRRRSLTVPPAEGPEDSKQCQRSSSSSPMLSLQASTAATATKPATKRRRCVTTELRKQLAAKSSTATAMQKSEVSPMAGSLGRSFSLQENSLSFDTPFPFVSPHFDMSPMSMPISDAFVPPPPISDTQAAAVAAAAALSIDTSPFISAANPFDLYQTPDSTAACSSDVSLVGGNHF